jgi:outer membrane protein
LLLAVTLTCSGGEPNPRDIDKPLWELGLFSGVASIPHYRGSDESETYLLPLPYMIYRGERIQASREGLRGVLYQSDYLESSLSFSGNPPVDSDNDARRGMEELDLLLEGGPALQWYPLGYDPLHRFYFRLAGRAVFSFSEGFDVDYQGLRATLDLVYRKRHFLGVSDLTGSIKTGVEASNQRYNRYFYDVTEKDVLEDRAAFSSGEGYAGANLSANLLKRINERFSVGVIGRWDNIAGTPYVNSPLVREENTYILGVAIIWEIAVSDKRVSVDL